MPPQVQDVVQRASLWERVAAPGIVLGVALLTWLCARFASARPLTGRRCPSPVQSRVNAPLGVPRAP